MTSPKPPNATDSARYTNTAKKGSFVAAQIGVVHGDQYFYVAQDTPEEKYRVGRNYLDAHAQQRAEELIREAFMSGYQTIEVAYYWSLAILSGRPFDHLKDDDLDRLGCAFQLIDDSENDRWRQPLTVVRRLFDCIAWRNARTASEDAEFKEAMHEFDLLPRERREEIRRHLEMILDGEMQDQFDAQSAQEITVERLSNNRRERAWKYFEPDPTLPRQRQPRPASVAPRYWATVAGGTVLTSAALSQLVPLAVRGGMLSAAGALVFCGLGVGLVAGQRWERLSRENRRRAGQAERAAIPDDAGEMGQREAPFLQRVKETIDTEFRYVIQPTDNAAARAWNKATKGIRNALARELADTYGDQADLNSIKWLMRWYARDTLQKWKKHALPDPRAGHQPPRFGALRLIAGVSAAAFGGYLGLAAAFSTNWAATVLATVALVVGGIPLSRAATAIYLEYFRHADDLLDVRQRYEEQKAAYRKVRDMLKDRPTDEEMARWLDYDKAYVRMRAMRHYRLNNRDVIAHTVLSEGVPVGRYARMVYGPPRYETYKLLVFLLSERGVWQYGVTLEFITAVVKDGTRRTFGYEAIAAAEVAEHGVLLDGTQSVTAEPASRHDAPARDNENRAAGNDADALVLSRSFCLTLVSGQAFAVRVENFDEGLIDRMKERPESLLELTLDVAGITAALHTLEAVAAEGKDWIAQERRRRERKMRTYQETGRFHRSTPSEGPTVHKEGPTDPGSPERARLAVLDPPTPTGPLELE
jgi:hypothetical protein